MSQVDQAILDALRLSSSDVTLTSLGSSFSDVAKLSCHHGPDYFLKISRDETMIRGESASYAAISAACPDFCPSVIADGVCTTGAYFLVTTFLTFQSRQSLARSLAQLHDATNDQFGFDVATCCADTVQDNEWTSSWCEFFIRRRLLPISRLRTNAQDAELQMLVERACETSVPRLLNQLQIRPALIHGDLWSGNARGGQVFDSCACYAHSEFELSIMSMFGGFSQDLQEYETLKKRDEPVEEYDDRIALYMCYHQLNHSGTGQGSHYKTSAKQTLQRLNHHYGGSTDD